MSRTTVSRLARALGFLLFLICGALRPAAAQTTTITFDQYLRNGGEVTQPYGQGIRLFHAAHVPPGPPVALATQDFAFTGFVDGVMPIAPLAIIDNPALCASAFGGPACVSNGTRYLMTDLPFEFTWEFGGNFSLLAFAASQVFGGVPPGGPGQPDAVTIQAAGFRGEAVVAQETFTLSATFQTFALSDPAWVNVSRVVFTPRSPNGTPGAVAIDDIATGARPRRPGGDFDGDGRTDLAIYRQATGTWYIAKSSTGFADYDAHQWGFSDDTPVPGDYDGDGKADVAVYRPATGVWYILLSSTNHSTYAAYRFGAHGDIPAPGDYDGDGRTDIAVYRRELYTRWYALLSSTDFSSYVEYFVSDKGVPLPGDYDNDGKTDCLLFDEAFGQWEIWPSRWGYFHNRYLAWAGQGLEIVAAGDYNGDGQTDFGFFRPDLSLWRLWFSPLSPIPTEVIVPFGLPGDVPTTGDFDGDGTDDIALYRPATGDWYIATSTTNFAFYVAYRWGVPGDLPAIRR